MSDKPRELNHPCAGTCSGWNDGYVKGKYELKAEADKLAEALEICIRDLQSISVVNDSKKQQNLAKVCRDEAKQALAEYRGK